MTLRGDFAEFALEDVLRLIVGKRTTGVLRVRARGGREGEREGALWFREGAVLCAGSGPAPESFGTRLVSTGVVTADDLSRAEHLHEADPAAGSLGDRLVAEHLVAREALELTLEAWVEEVVFDLLGRDEGEFDFGAGTAPAGPDIGVAVSMERILGEGSARPGDWARLRTDIGSLDTVTTRVPLLADSDAPVQIDPSEWNLLLLVDGQRTIRELARTAGRAPLEVAVALQGLLARRLVEVSVRTPEGEVLPDSAPSPARADVQSEGADLRYERDTSGAKPRRRIEIYAPGEPVRAARPDEICADLPEAERVAPEPAERAETSEPAAKPEAAERTETSEPAERTEMPEAAATEAATPPFVEPRDAADGALVDPTRTIPEGDLGDATSVAREDADERAASLAGETVDGSTRGNGRRAGGPSGGDLIARILDGIKDL